MKHEILIYNKTKRKVPEKFIKTAVVKILDLLKLKQPIEMAVLIIGGKEIKRLNKIWRKKNETPDELSFGLNSREMTRFANDRDNVINLGEIAVNVEKISDKRHLLKILIHSLLHLLGYSHKQMEKFEKNLEIKLKIT